MIKPGSKIRAWPSDLTFRRVRDLFFPDDREAPEYPAMAWPAGSIPPHPTPLDCFIENLRRSQKARRLRPADELGRLGIACPFYEARVGVMLAVGYANVRTFPDKEQRQSRSVYKQVARKYKKLHGDLLALKIKNEKNAIPFPNPRDSYARSLMRGEAEIFNTEYVACIADEAERLAERIKVVSSNSLGEFQIFVTSLGYVWKNITGNDPVANVKYNPSSGFDDYEESLSFGAFIRASWHSCGSDIKYEPSWQHHCLEAVNSVPKGKWERLETEGTISPMGYEHAVFARRLWGGPPINESPARTTPQRRQRDADRAKKISSWHQIIADTRSDIDTLNDQATARYFLTNARAYWFGPKCDEILQKLDIRREFADDEIRPPPCPATIDELPLWTPVELRRRDEIRAEKISSWHQIIADTRSDIDTQNDQITARYFLANARAYWFGPKCDEILQKLDISRTFADDEVQPPPLDPKYLSGDGC